MPKSRAKMSLGGLVGYELNKLMGTNDDLVAQYEKLKGKLSEYKDEDALLELEIEKTTELYVDNNKKLTENRDLLKQTKDAVGFYTDYLVDAKSAIDNAKTSTSLYSGEIDTATTKTRTFRDRLSELTGTASSVAGSISGSLGSIGGMLDGLIQKGLTFRQSLSDMSSFGSNANTFPGMLANGAGSSFGRIPAYASGGTPDSGQLFIAREAGAELVGSIGNKTAVMNNDQIVESVSQGVADANAEQSALLREQNTINDYFAELETLAA